MRIAVTASKEIRSIEAVVLGTPAAAHAGTPSSRSGAELYLESLALRGPREEHIEALGERSFRPGPKALLLTRSIPSCGPSCPAWSLHWTEKKPAARKRTTGRKKTAARKVTAKR
ncbi:MAG: hypothetical protein U0V56_06765 [Actinomycetota bacterium]